jgi:hypothetical protein
MTGTIDLPISTSRAGNIIVIFILLLFHNVEFHESLQGWLFTIALYVPYHPENSYANV